jgi:hypothetical protein
VRRSDANATWIRRLLGWLARWYGVAARWPARWVFGAGLVYTAVSLVLYGVSPTSQMPGSDGHYSWVYARSLAYDGDLDFSNDYAVCGDPFGIGWTTPAQRPANFFYFGPAVFWTPLAWILKHFARGSARVEAGCVGLVPANVLLLSSIAGGVLVLTVCALLRRVVGDRLAALTALVATLGGHALYFTALSPSYSHVYDAMCVALFLYVLVRMREREDSARSPESGAKSGRGSPPLRLALLAGGLLGLAILQRASNAVFFAVAVGALLRPSPRDALRRSVGGLLAVGGAALATGVVPLLAVNRAIYGRPLLYAHGPHFVHLGHAHPWLLLFNERGGVFAWAPVLWLAVPGLVLLVRMRELRWLVVPLLLCSAIEIYLSSAALDYEGARRLLNLTPLGAYCIALVLQRLAGWVVARPGRAGRTAAVALLAAIAWPNVAVCFGYAHGKLGWDVPLTLAERFGEGEKQTTAAVESTVGGLDALPAEWIFALRYRLRPSAFGWASHPQWYQRDMRSLEYTRNDFAFLASESRALLRGFRIDADSPAACIAGRTASAVFATQWPFATRARLTYDATQAQTLSTVSRSFVGIGTRWEDAEIRPGTANKAFVRIPAGGFDSGINELEFEPSGDAGSLCLRALELIDDTPYPRAPEAEPRPPVVLWHGEELRPDGSAAPTVAVGSGPAGAWVVEANEVSGGQMVYAAGRPGEMSSPSPLGRGFRPRVAAGSADVVLEVEQAQPGPGALWCRTGRVNGASPAVTWLGRVACGTGYHPALAAGQGQAVGVTMNDASSGSLSFRTGRYGPDGIRWGDPDALEGPGFEPVVALLTVPGGSPGALVVEVHQEKTGFGLLWMRTGRLDAAGAIAWGQAFPYEVGVFPSIAGFGATLVEVHQGQDEAGSLRMKIGSVDADGVVRWQAARSYDTGGHPVFAADAASGKGVEAHEGKLGFGSLWNRAAEVY